MASYPPQRRHEIHPQKQRGQQRPEPRPLRIVKRHRSTESGGHGEEHVPAPGADGDSDVSDMIDGAQRLHISKRRSRGRHVVAGGPFHGGLGEIGSAQKRAWGEAVASCRGLLRRSTPDIRSCRRFLSFGQTSSSDASCGSRVSSADSSRRRGSTDDGRRQLSSASSCEADCAGALAGGRAVQQWTPDVDCGRKRRDDGSPQQLSPRQMARNTGGYILSPHVVVTAHGEETLGEGARVWAAVEISGKLSRIASSSPPTGDETHGGPKSSGTFVNHKTDRFFDFGCLYDLTAEVHSTQDATVLEVIQEQPWPTTIYAGTSVLLVVHVQLDGKTDGGDGRGHSRCRSEELMEELELQLGHVRSQLLRVTISYRHSAFPTIHNAHATEDGLCQLQSRMETTATAALVPSCNDSVWASRTRRASSSWSSRSSRSSSSRCSLFRLMVQHWGDGKAIEVQRRISDSHVMLPSRHQLDFGRLDARPVAADQHAAESRWKVWSGQDGKALESGEGQIRTPVGEIYYFGERAIKALKSPAGHERDEFGTRSSGSKHNSAAGLDVKDKDVRFWDWGKWF
ncbi:hypothetical protein E4U53_002267 [Claviceps sorghi]|nr:hypothetical protein E4U53_002267 [Claviceps sorghi]